MNNSECIIFFTKDRLKTLSKNLSQLADIDLPVIVIDNSPSTKANTIIKNTINKMNNVHYHGICEQKEILKEFNKVVFNLDCFIKPLGAKGWTLGYARNYAIILTKALGFKKILFMDDDIIMKGSNIIRDIMGLLDNVNFVGARIGGMPDDSIVGHIMRELGIVPFEFLSGGFFGVNLNSVSEYFLNYYNEDWIWLFLHKPKDKILKYGEVYQLPQDPFENAIQRALKQELGEILFDAVHVAFKRNDFSLLMQKDFMDAIIGERIIEIEWLLEFCKGKKVERIGVNVCKGLLDYHSKLKPNTFNRVFADYFDKRKNWLYILREVTNKKIDGMIRNLKFA